MLYFSTVVFFQRVQSIWRGIFFLATCASLNKSLYSANHDTDTIYISGRGAFLNWDWIRTFLSISSKNVFQHGEKIWLIVKMALFNLGLSPSIASCFSWPCLLGIRGVCLPVPLSSGHFSYTVLREWLTSSQLDGMSDFFMDGLPDKAFQLPAFKGSYSLSSTEEKRSPSVSWLPDGISASCHILSVGKTPCLLFWEGRLLS